MADLQSYLQLVLLFAVSTIFLQSIIQARRRRKQNQIIHLPPTPPSIPIIGHLHLLSPLPHQDFHKLSTGKNMDILVAGTDTTAVTMEWATAELINNPRVMEKARQELDAVIGKKRIVDESDIVNLPTFRPL
ncbi:hypothetical protein S83_053643 [Arachis hypogaea]